MEGSRASKLYNVLKICPLTKTMTSWKACVIIKTKSTIGKQNKANKYLDNERKLKERKDGRERLKNGGREGIKKSQENKIPLILC
jgi:hypothetical protein